MSDLQVKFVNYSREALLIHPIPERTFAIKLLPGKTLKRDAKIGTIEAMPSRGMPKEVHRPELQWIKKPTEITWEDCPDDCDFAPFKTVSFYDGNIVKTRKRRFWKPPELKFPTVEFYFNSKQYRTHMFQLDTMTTLYSGIPGRRVVPLCSKYAPWKKWIFEETATSARLVDPFTGKGLSRYEIGSGHGENPRTGEELEKVQEITARDKQERLAQVI